MAGATSTTPGEQGRGLLWSFGKKRSGTPRSGRLRLRGRYGLKAFDAASRVGEASSLMDETSHHDAMRLILGRTFVKFEPVEARPCPKPCP